MKGKKAPNDQAEFWERMYRAEYDARIKTNEQIGAYKHRVEAAERTAVELAKQVDHWKQEAWKLTGYVDRVRETDPLKPAVE